MKQHMAGEVKLIILDKSLQMITLSNKDSDFIPLQMSNLTGFSKSTIHHIVRTFFPYGHIGQNMKTNLGFGFLSA